MSAHWAAPPGSPERLLLRAAVAAEPAAGEAYRAWRERQSVEELDWPAHRVLALLADRLNVDDDDPVARRIQRVARVTWLKTQMLLARTEPALAALRAEGIPVLLCKGVAVLEHTDWQVHQRPMDDVDIAVPHASASRAATVLRGAGFACPHLPVDPARTTIYRQLHALPFTDAAGAVIDLHWSLLHGSLHPQANRDFWDAARPTHLKGVACLVPRREDVLLQVLGHGQELTVGHAMLWVADAVLLLRAAGGEFDWDRLARQARRQRMAGPIAAGLAALADYTPELVPATRRRRPPTAALAPRAARGERELPGAGPLLAGRWRRETDDFTEWVRRNVAPGARLGKGHLSRMLQERWGLARATDVRRHAAWVLSGRRPRLARWRGAPPPPAAARTTIGVPGEIGFLSGERGHTALAGGWWEPADEHGTWSRGTEAGLQIPLADPHDGALELTLWAVPHLGPTHPHLRVDLLLEGRRVARWGYTGVDLAPARRSAIVPPRVGRTDLELRLLVRGRISPNTARREAELRPLGIALQRLRVAPAPAGEGLR